LQKTTDLGVINRYALPPLHRYSIGDVAIQFLFSSRSVREVGFRNPVIGDQDGLAVKATELNVAIEENTPLMENAVGDN
jgi:hypothetical protein